MTLTASKYRFPAFTTTPEERQGPAMAKAKALPHEFGLSQEQIDFFWQHGYVSLPGTFNATEAKAISDAADLIYNDSERVDPFNTRYNFAKVLGKEQDEKQGEKQDKEKDKGQDLLWKIDPFFDLHPVLRKCVFDRRILDPLASLYEGREPRLFKDKLIYKPPHTHGNGLHQDYNWWQGYPTSLISVTVSIDATNEDNGCTVVYPRDPRLGFMGEKGSFNNDKIFAGDPSYTKENAVKNITQPGDVLLFHCFTLHEAGANTTDRFRRQMFLSYNDSVDGEYYFSHGEHYRQYYKANMTEPEKYHFQ